MEPRIWIDGEPLAAGDGLSPRDRGLAYGDGLFETIAVRDGEPELLADHLRRLARGCRRLALPAPDEAQLEHEARA